MTLTLINYAWIAGIIICTIIAAALAAWYANEAYSKKDENKKKKLVISVAVIGLVITGLTAFGFNWYNTSTASGVRSYKDWQSELNNGINREIIITAEDGREIFHYEGKVDIESNHEDNYIKFEGEDGRRYMIYYGIQDTILIIEKEDE